jgi:3-oxoacyl-[acyl-carrier-protein] synthase III
MLRAQILGIGSYVPDRVITNDELAYLDDQHLRHTDKQLDITDEWVQARTGIVERRYVANDGKTACSDLALHASRRAIEDAGCTAADIDCIVYATLSPDIHFPGNAVFLQSKLGIDGDRGCPCFDIRQQCSGFIYGLQMADAFVRGGLYKRVLIVGAELHSHSLEYDTEGRDVTVLFGDGAGAAVIGPLETDDPKAGILYTSAGANGAGAMDLYLKVFDVTKMPHIRYDAAFGVTEVAYPQMKGKRVFLNAVRAMSAATRDALSKTGLSWDDLDWFVPHQANLRINEALVHHAKIPEAKVLNSIQLYGNTTAATVPLTIDHHRKLGTVKRGDLILSTVFGAGYTWGAAVFRV